VNYTSQILFALGAIGSINGLIVALYFLISPKLSNKSNRLFGAFLLILSLRILKSVFYAFSTEEPIWFLQFGPSFFGLIGPFLFTYVLSIVKPDSLWIKYRRYHLLFWFLILTMTTFLIPFNTNREFNKDVLLPALNYLWLGYIIGSSFYLIIGFRTRELSTKLKWLILFLSINLLLWASFSFIEFEYFISGSIVFSMFFYSIFLFFLLNRKVSDRIFIKSNVKKPVFDTNQANLLIERLQKLFKSEEPYKDPNLKIVDIAEKLGISSHELSRLINQVLGKSFTEFINEYRVEEAKSILQKESFYTIEAIGEQSGFNSKSAFYKAFKAKTRTTPAKYKARL
jgi:AraC-like DNA-binding protein